MGNELAIKLEIPILPEAWDYDESVKKVKQWIYKWKTLTTDMAQELYVAREKLSREGNPHLQANIPTGTFVPVKTWNQYCEEIGHSRQVVNRWLARWFLIAIADKKFLPMPPGKYSIIYADPPWQYDFSATECRKIEKEYSTEANSKLIKLNLPDMPKNSVLYLWATAPKLREALSVMSEWGFEYKTHSIWDKEIIGMGYWFRGQHELLMVGVKGKVPPPPQEMRVSSILHERRGKHSKKPETIYEWIEKWYPKQKWIELFARKKRDGWTVWGNEI